MNETGRHPMTMRQSSILMVAALAAVALTACGGSEASEVDTIDTSVVLTQQDVAAAETRSVGAGAVVTGTLEPYRRVEVRAQVPGVVTDLRVDRGDAVGAGQVIARIEAEGIRGQAASAQAGVAAAAANLALARRQLESARTLHEAGAMSDIEFEQVQAAYGAAQAQLAAAEAQSVGAGESARRATLTAPIAGEISDRSVSAGEAVNVGQPLVTIVNSSVLELQGSVPVNNAVGICAGMPVEFAIDAYPGRVFGGSVARVEPTADPGTRQVGVYVRLPNQDRGLLGGVFATGRILTGERITVTVVPQSAVRGTGADAHVFAVREGRAVRVPVQLGARSEAEGVVEITAGLEAGETVIVAPGTIEDGTEVRFTAPAAVAPEEGR
jgi:membrane fusion protein, multidrug efflux system